MSLSLGIATRGFYGGSGGSSEDVVSPVVEIISPTVGSVINRTTPIVIDVYSTLVPLRRAWINASYAGLLQDDMVHNGDRFGAAYQGGTNTRVAITFGYRFTLLRDGGWPGTPSMEVHAVDTLGIGDEP